MTTSEQIDLTYHFTGKGTGPTPENLEWQAVGAGNLCQRQQSQGAILKGSK